MKYTSVFIHRLQVFAECERGIAYVEFALCVTSLLLLFMGSVELTRYVLILQKVENTVAMVVDVTTQTNPNSTPLSSSQMLQTMEAVTDMMSPYSQGISDPNIIVIVSDVTKTGASNPVLNWQYCGGGTLSETSKIGTVIGANVVLPTGFSMNAGEEAVIGEVYYSYAPIMNQSIISGAVLYRTAIYMPRLGALTGFSSHC